MSSNRTRRRPTPRAEAQRARPCRPTDALPKTAEKIEEMARRFERREELFSREDAGAIAGLQQRFERQRNGSDVCVGVRPVPLEPGEFTGVKRARETFGERLRRLRDERDMPVKVLVRRSGVSAAAISMLECGRRLPGMATLLRLAEALRVSLDVLCGRRAA